MTSINFTEFGPVQQKFISSFFEMETLAGRLDEYKALCSVGAKAKPWVMESIWMIEQLVGSASMSKSGNDAFRKEISRHIGEFELPIKNEQMVAGERETNCQPVNNAVSGFIYIAKNQAFQSFVKVGMTTRSVEKRLDELSKSTAAPFDFVCIRRFFSEDVVADEALIHSMLGNFRVSKNKEFFAVPDDVAIFACESVIGRGAL